MKLYQKILVPLDGSELAEGAIAYSEGLARRLNSEVVLLTSGVPGEYLERPLRAYLEKRAEELRSSGVKASQLVVRGDAATEILDFAGRNDVGLIIISTHGHTGISRWAMGSIANKVLQRSHLPTLLIRSGESEAAAAEKELRKFLVPLDGSRFAESIIPYVVGLAGGVGNEVILLRVIEPIKLYEAAFQEAVADWEKYEKAFMARAESKAKRYLTRKGNALRNKGIKVSSDLLLGKPAETILQYAEDKSVSLIAMATHGFSGITRWVWGSVAAKIIEGSSKPILLFRPSLPILSA